MPCNNELFVDMLQPSSFEELASLLLDKRPVKGIVQPPVKPPESKSHRNTNLLQYMLGVVSSICKLHDSWPFRKPVDTLTLKIPDYHAIVRHPMDFYTIRRRIQNSFYYDVNECIKDCRLVFYNCYLYNKHDTEIVSMAKKIENFFVQEMAKCPEKEVEIPVHIKSSISTGKRAMKNSMSVRTEIVDTETLATSASFPIERNLKLNQTAFMPTSPANTTATTSQMSKYTQFLICPGCGYHSERLQDFMQSPPVSKTSTIRTRQHSAQSSKTQAHQRSLSYSSDSSSSSGDFEKEIVDLKDRVKKLTEVLQYLVKEFNDNKKRKLEHQNKRRLKNELLHTPVVEHKIVSDNESPLVAVLPIHSVSTSPFSNSTLNKSQNWKQIQKSPSKSICALKPTAVTKKSAVKRAGFPKPATETKKMKTNSNTQKKQPMLATPAYPPPPPASTAMLNSGYRVKIEDANLKPMLFEEKQKLGEELSKLKGNAKVEICSIIKLMEPSCYDVASNAIELDVGALKLSTLRELQSYVDNLKKETNADDDDTSSTDSSSSTDSTCSSDSTSNSSSKNSHFWLHSDDSSSSSNTPHNGKKNSTVNAQSAVMNIATANALPDSTTIPVKVDQIVSHINPAFHSPNLQQSFVECKPCHPYIEDYKSLFPGPTTSKSVLQLKNYTGASCGPPKKSLNRIGGVNTLVVDQQSGYTRITKKVEQAEKKAQCDSNRRYMDDIIENAKKTMKMRENMRNEVQNQADHSGKGEIKIKEEI